MPDPLPVTNVLLRLVRAFERYGGHDANCAVELDVGDCDCGYAATVRLSASLAVLDVEDNDWLTKRSESFPSAVEDWERTADDLEEAVVLLRAYVEEAGDA